jgi:hypothetical protein
MLRHHSSLLFQGQEFRQEQLAADWFSKKKMLKETSIKELFFSYHSH